MPVADADYTRGALHALHALLSTVLHPVLRPLADIGVRILTGFLLFLLQIGTHIRRLALSEHRRCETKQNDFFKRAHALWDEFNAKNFKKLARVFNVLEPLSTDCIPVNTFERTQEPVRPFRLWHNGFPCPEWDMPSHNGPERIEHIVPVPHGHVRIVLRFRYGDLRQRVQDNNYWTVYSMKYSVTRDLSLEWDGTLSIDRIRKAFHIADIEFLQPDRYDLFKPATEDKLSKLAIYTLSEKYGAIHIIEHEDIFCRMRRKLRLWLRGSLISYFIRCAIFYLISWSIRAVLMYSMFRATRDLLAAYVEFVNVINGIAFCGGLAKAYVFISSLISCGYGWRCVDMFSSRMGLQKLTPQRQMKLWSKQIERLIC